VCTHGQKDGFICPGSTTFFTASVLWGVIGPRRVFSIGAPYSGLLWFFPIGAVLPIPFYFLSRRFPRSFWRYINVPIALAGLSSMPPASGINYISWGFAGFVSNYVLRRFRFRWWMRYNYIMSAGLDAGLAFSMIVIFLFLSLPKGGITLNWWGNTVWYNNADGNGLPLKTLAEGATFGPSSW
jgi:OPT family oligopeptide transporter